jgi:hypothetical protein
MDNIYISCFASIRFISNSSGLVETLAGSSKSMPFQDGLGSNATFNNLGQLVVTIGSSVIVADAGNNRIRMLSCLTGYMYNGKCIIRTTTPSVAPTTNPTYADVDNYISNITVNTAAGLGSSTNSDGVASNAKLFHVLFKNKLFYSTFCSLHVFAIMLHSTRSGLFRAFSR